MHSHYKNTYKILFGVSRESEPRGDIYIYKEIYYKELVHVTMEAERSHNLWSASWRAKGASSVVPV